MKNIYNYIKKYGKSTFDDVEFNEIDNLVFASLSYVDLPQELFLEKKYITIGELALNYFTNHTKKDISNNIIAVREAIKIFDSIKDTERYKNLEVFNYVYSGDYEKQFCALSIKLPDNTIYISFEGTDELISGWKEDFQLSYMFPVPSQKMAIEYLNKNIKFKDKKIIVGGHSKGGNLALVSAMYCHFWIRKKIVAIYNNDGPGLRKPEIESRKYKKIENKLIYIIPNYSFIGLLLRHSDNYKVVESYDSGILAHNLGTWKIEGTNFIETNLSFISREFDEATTIWLDKYDYEQRKIFVESLFQVCDRLGINNLLEIKHSKITNIIKIIKDTKNIDRNTKDMITSFFKFLIKYCSLDIKDKLIKRN